METNKQLSPSELKDRVMRFYARYGPELDQIKELLAIKIRQLALAYTINNQLPREAVTVTARVKSAESLIRKLERSDWPQFYYPTEVVKDLVGGRIVCWFLDDCYGLLKFIRTSNHFKVHDDSHFPIRDYIRDPQSAGYRAIHVFAVITYDSVQRKGGVDAGVVPQDILCEIQVRTQLQHAWADITHEFFYKARDAGINSSDYESFLADLSERLAVEDKSFMKFRNVYQKMADAKQAERTREGFRDES